MRRAVALLVALGALASAGPVLADASVTVGDASGYYNAYFPSDVTINVGGKVTWTWAGGFNPMHSVTANDGSFDSKVQGAGSVFTHTFAASGTYTYYCLVHGPAMSGTLHVLGPGGASAPAIGKAKAKPSGKVSFTLSAPAKVTVVVRRKGKSNVVRRRTVNGKAGANTVAFSVKGLTAGQYVVTLKATNAGGGSRTVNVGFCLKKR